jgi:hypothetical protein
VDHESNVVDVTQADRDAAADLAEMAQRLSFGGNDAAAIRLGLWDTREPTNPDDVAEFVHRVARHRIATIAALNREVEAGVKRLRKRLEDRDEDVSACYRQIDQEIVRAEAAEAKLAEAVGALVAAEGSLDQLLGDMGERGLCVCEEAKDEARISLDIVTATLAKLEPETETLTGVGEGMTSEQVIRGYFAEQREEESRRHREATKRLNSEEDAALAALSEKTP